MTTLSTVPPSNQTSPPASTVYEEQEPYIRLRPQRSWSSLVNISDVWEFRDLLIALATRDIKLRYRQTALGAIWVVFQPLLGAGIFSVVFGRLAKFPSDGVPYFLFAFVGQMAWSAFSGVLTKSSGSLIGSANLISKIYFPRLILPLSTVFSVLIDFGVSFVMLLVLMLMNHIVPHVTFLLMPVLLALLLMLSSGIGLFAAALSVTYRDIQYILPVMIPFLMYASPVAYSVSAVPEKLRSIYFLNPLASLMDAFRWATLGTGSPNFVWLAYSVVVSILVFFGGIIAFRHMERRFADVI